MSTLGVGGVNPDAAATHVSGAALLDPVDTEPRQVAAASAPHEQLESLIASIGSEIQGFRQQENARKALSTPPAELAAALEALNKAWSPVTERLAEVFERFRAVHQAALDIPVADLSSDHAREHSRTVAQSVLSLDGYKTEFSSLTGKLSVPAREMVAALLTKVAGQGSSLLDAYNEKAARWIDGLDRNEAEALDRRQRLERAPHIRELRDEVVLRCFRSFSSSDIVGPAGDIQHQFVLALNPESGQINSAALRSMATSIAEANLSAGTKKLLTELCHACLVEAARVKGGDLSGSLSENILALRTQAPDLGPADRTNLRIEAFRESFAAAVDRYNADNAVAPLSRSLIETAKLNFIKLIDSSTGQIIPAKEEWCRAFLHPEYDLKLPISGERVSREQRKFLMDQLDLFVAEPRPISVTDIEALLAGDPPVEAASAAEVVDTETSGPAADVVPNLHRDKEVKLPHGVGLVFELSNEGPSSVRILDGLTGSKAEFALGSKFAPADVVAALIPLREKLRAASISGSTDAALLRETVDTLNAFADGPAELAPQKLVKAESYFPLGGAKKGGLRVTDQPKPTDAYEILTGNRRVTLTAERGDPAAAWHKVILERKADGIFVTLRSNEQLLARSASDRLPRHSDAAEVTVKIADNSISQQALSKRINALLANMSGTVLERPKFGDENQVVLGGGEMLTRVLAQGEVVSLRRCALCLPDPVELKLAPAAVLEDLTFVSSRLKLSGSAGAVPAAQFRNVVVAGGSEIESENLQGSSCEGLIVSADSVWAGDMSGSTFTASKFYGESANGLEMRNITWLRGRWPGGFNLPPAHAEIVRAR